ncbi:MAG: amino acid adenylation domain-containing protein [Elusimicrobia bacterium]|nr:amino acid adenylation domain-containing protein [Elusimicrobiota bacterium]
MSTDRPARPQGYLLPISASSAPILASFVRAYQEFFSYSKEQISLRDLCYTASVPRGHHDYRIAVAFQSHEELVQRLAAHERNEPNPYVHMGRKSARPLVKLAFVFNGQGNQYCGMGRELLERNAVFRAKLQECDEILKRLASWSIVEELGKDGAASRLMQTEIAQVTLVALQASLTALWRSWGVEPDGVVGHSVGEIGAAYACGAVDLETAIRIAYHRGRLMQRAAGQGKMAAVGLSLEEARTAVSEYSGRLSIAAVNGPKSTVLSGEVQALEEAVKRQKERHIFVRMLNGDHAFHSHQMDPVLDELAASLQGLKANWFRCPIFSTVTGHAATIDDFGVEYWTRNVREPVLFENAVGSMIRDGFNTFIEIGPHPALALDITKSLEERETEGTVVPSLKRDEGEELTLLNSLGALYASGFDVDWTHYFPARGRFLQLSTQAERRRLWASEEARPQVDAGGHPLLEHDRIVATSGKVIWNIESNVVSAPYLQEYLVQESAYTAAILPATAYIDLIFSAVREHFGAEPAALEKVRLRKICPVDETGRISFHLVLSPSSGGVYSFEILGGQYEQGADDSNAGKNRESPQALVDGEIRLKVAADMPACDLNAIQKRCSDVLHGAVHDQILKRQGLILGPSFKGVEQVWRRDGEALAKVRITEAVSSEIDRYRFHPAVMDACIQSVYAALPKELGWSLKSSPFLTTGLASMRVYGQPVSSSGYWGHAVLKGSKDESGRSIQADVEIMDERGEVLASISGWTLHRVDDRKLGKRDDAEKDAASAKPLQIPEENRAQWLVQTITGLLEEAVGAGIDPTQPIITHGIDSLRAVSIRNQARARFGLQLPVVGLLGGLNVPQLAAAILKRLEAQPNLPSSPSRAARADGQPARKKKIGQFPLSEGQSGLWMIHQLSPNNGAYNTNFAVHIRSEIDIPALRKSLQALVDRHEMLRTTYRLNNGVPTQEIHERLEFILKEEDVSSLSREEIEKRLSAEAMEPFDLERGPVIRSSLYVKSPKDCYWILTVHHIAWDHWSLGIALRELEALYVAAKSGSSASLPAAEVDYVDYVRYQDELMKGPEGERLRDYWRKQLAGELPILNVSTDFPRPPAESFRGATARFELDEDLTRRLRALAANEKKTLYTVLLAAFQVLLRRYSGQEEILLGSPMLGARSSDFKGVIGDFINSVVLRADLSGDPSFSKYLERTQHVVLEAMDHQDYPFQRVVKDVQPARDASRSPIFQVMFNLLKEPTIEFRLGGLDIESVPLPRQEGQFDLDLILVEGSSVIKGALAYRTDLFKKETAERIIGHLRVLLNGIVARPDSALTKLPIMSQEEARRMLVEWNDTPMTVSPELTVHRMFEEQAERTPDAIAVEFEGETVTYGELDRRADRLAGQLRSLGAGPEALVGICVKRSVNMIVGLLGILKSGAAYVPIDPDYPKDRVAYMLEDSRGIVLITEKSLVDNLPSHNAKVLGVDFDSGVSGEAKAADPARRVSGESVAYTIYTSGSTGKPKGVQVLHRAVVNILEFMKRSLSVGDRDKLLAVTTLSFDIAGLELFLPLVSGARLIVATRETALDGTRLAKELERTGATIMQATPVTWRLLLGAGWKRGAGLRILCGGEAWPQSLASQLLATGASLYNVYGPTETTIWSTFHKIEEGRPVVIGRPLANTQMYVLDAHMQPVPVGVAGDLYIGGLGLARGYFNRPELTAEKFVANPFGEPGSRIYKTGDVAQYLPDGTIDFMGRIDHQVKIRGFRIEIGEIETALGRHPLIQQQTVIARDDGSGEKRLVAYLVGKQQPAPSTSELREFLKQTLPEYMVPASFMFLDAMPLTPNGKVDRRALPEPSMEARPTLTVDFENPQGQLETIIAGIWQEVLHLSPIGVNDNFFDLGGHSLSLLRVHNKLKEQLDRDVPVVEMFRHPTISALARYFQQGSGETAQAVAKKRGPTATSHRDRRMEHRKKKEGS